MNQIRYIGIGFVAIIRLTLNGSKKGKLTLSAKVYSHYNVICFRNEK